MAFASCNSSRTVRSPNSRSRAIASRCCDNSARTRAVSGSAPRPRAAALSGASRSRRSPRAVFQSECCWRRRDTRERYRRLATRHDGRPGPDRLATRHRPTAESRRSHRQPRTTRAIGPRRAARRRTYSAWVACSRRRRSTSALGGPRLDDVNCRLLAVHERVVVENAVELGVPVACIGNPPRRRVLLDYPDCGERAGELILVDPEIGLLEPALSLKMASQVAEKRMPHLPKHRRFRRPAFMDVVAGWLVQEPEPVRPRKWRVDRDRLIDPGGHRERDVSSKIR